MRKKKEGLRHPQKTTGTLHEKRIAQLLEENERLKREISECLDAKQKMFEREERYKLLFDAGNDMVFVHGYNNGEVDTFIEVNEKACEVLGYSKDELKTLTPQDITVENVSKQLSTGSLREGEKLLVEKTLITKTGKHVPVEINTQIFYLHRKPTALSIVRDITERKQALKALKASEQKLRMLIYNSPVGVSTSDLQGNFLEVNPVLCNIMGYSEEELLGKHYNLFSHPEDRAKNLELSEKLLKGEISSFDLEKRFIQKNGTVVDILIRAQLIRDEKGKALYQTAVVEDITERKKAEQDLRVALKKANESDRLKSAFLATMSHELRTPLNAIIGFSELLKEDLSAADVKKFGKIIHSSGLHLLSIVNDLFDITLIESGEAVLRKTPTNLQILFYEVKSIIDKKREMDNKMDIGFNLRLPENEKNLEVLIDANKVKQILINLLKNAFKFTDNGSVNLGVNTAFRNGKYFLDFYVSDTGIGIERDMQEIIFNIFRQVEDSNIRKYGGTGIGLAVAKRLAGIMGGKIGLESEPGKGSTFNVSIPFELSEPQATSGEKHMLPKRKLNMTGSILIIEDDEPSFLLLKVLLEENGIQVLWVKNAEEAIQLCTENGTISLVLMDIHLPEMNGYRATEKIKALRPNLPIIAQTAFATMGDREKALQAGCNDYMAKPIHPEELLTKIHQLFP